MNGFPLLFASLRCELSRNQFLPPCILGHHHQKTSNFTSAHLFLMLIDNLNASTYRGPLAKKICQMNRGKASCWRVCNGYFGNYFTIQNYHTTFNYFILIKQQLIMTLLQLLFKLLPRESCCASVSSMVRKDIFRDDVGRIKT